MLPPRLMGSVRCGCWTKSGMSNDTNQGGRGKPSKSIRIKTTSYDTRPKGLTRLKMKSKRLSKGSAPGSRMWRPANSAATGTADLSQKNEDCHLRHFSRAEAHD